MANKRRIITFMIMITGALLIALLIALYRTFVASEPYAGTRWSDESSFIWNYRRLLLPFTGFLIGVMTGLIMLYYYFPEIRFNKKNNVSSLTPHSSPFEVVKHISTEDEKKVLEALRVLGGRAYKFEIAKKSNLSKIKTHRIIKRLVDRDILLADKYGKFVRVEFAPWVYPENESSNKN